MKLTLAVTTIGALCMVTASAWATETTGNTHTLAPIIIHGRAQVPVAAVEVSRASPALALTELRQPFLDRVEAATRHDPY